MYNSCTNDTLNEKLKLRIAQWGPVVTQRHAVMQAKLLVSAADPWVMWPLIGCAVAGLMTQPTLTTCLKDCNATHLNPDRKRLPAVQSAPWKPFCQRPRGEGGRIHA